MRDSAILYSLGIGKGFIDRNHLSEKPVYRTSADTAERDGWISDLSPISPHLPISPLVASILTGRLPSLSECTGQPVSWFRFVVPFRGEPWQMKP